MQKYLFLLLFLLPLTAFSQKKTDAYVSASYFGEMLTHPGLRLGLNIPVNVWGENKHNHLDVGPSVGMFHHRRYQTGYFFINDFTYRKTTKKNNCLAAGVGIGFMNTQVPNAYLSLPDGSVHIPDASHWYMLVDLFVCFNKSISLKDDKSVDMFFKPQLILAYPNFPVSLGYLVMEIGVRHKISI